MKISKAFPRLLEKKTPKVEDKTTVLEAITILRTNRLNALPVASARRTIPEGARSRSSSYAITGYSVISNLAEMDPMNYQRFLGQPCEDIAMSIGSVSFEKDDLLSLLHVYESSTFGFALVGSNNGKRKQESLLSLSDLLQLYKRKVLSSSLTARDIASSPVFSLAGNSLLSEILPDMIRRRFRRVRVSNSQSIVTDRQIIDCFLKKARTGSLRKDPNELLETKLESLEARSVPLTDSTRNIGEVAELIAKRNIDCVLCNTGIITPWDLIIKPWRMGRLNIAE